MSTTTTKTADTGNATGTQSGSGTIDTTTGEGPLAASHGGTTISDVVVQKIAALAAREVGGVHDLGGGTARTFGAIKERIPGASASTGQGVAVEVGERQAAIDLDVVVEYGVAIPAMAHHIRRNVITAVEQMTGLEVVEVNLAVNDVHLPGEEDDSAESTRVQ